MMFDGVYLAAADSKEDREQCSSILEDSPGLGPGDCVGECLLDCRVWSLNKMSRGVFWANLGRKSDMEQGSILLEGSLGLCLGVCI